MSRPADNLLQILELERIERNLFRGRNEDRGGGRLFGGQVVAQALNADLGLLYCSGLNCQAVTGIELTTW